MTKITSPGVYDIPIEDYHSQCCDVPSISSTGLKEVDACPAKFWAHSDLNPNRRPKKERKALSFGKAAHALVLGEPEFAKHFIISPYDEFRSGDAKTWKAEQTRQILKADDFETVGSMADAMRASEQCARAFVNGRAEQSYFFKDDETGVMVKSRPDWTPERPRTEFFSDYKTAASIAPGALKFDVFKYGYHIQAAIVIDAVTAVEGFVPLGVAHVMQEKEEPYLAELRMFSEGQLMLGRITYRRALRKFADCLSSGKWPGYTNEPQYFETPFNVERQMENMNDDGNGDNAEEPSGLEYFAAE
jgi:hypothetical protein